MTLQFDVSFFLVSFFVSEVVVRSIPKLRLWMSIGRKKIKIHHGYLGALLLIFASSIGHVPLFNIGLGTMVNDFLCHLRNLRKKFRK